MMNTATQAQDSIRPSRALAPEARLTLNWVLIGVTAGILADLAYFLSVTGLFGLKPSYFLGMAFGPLLSIAFVGFYYFFRSHSQSPTLQVAVLFGVIAGAIVNMMIVVQGAQRFAIPVASRQALGAAWEASNMVQLGLDVSWDIFLALATVLLAVVIWGHPRFHKTFALVTGLLGAGLLIFNLWTFPIPPAEAGLIDLGPFVGAWYLVLALSVLRSRGWLAEQLQMVDQPNG